MTCLFCGDGVPPGSNWVGHLCLCCGERLVACASCVVALPAAWAAWSALDTKHARVCAAQPERPS